MWVGEQTEGEEVETVSLDRHSSRLLQRHERNGMVVGGVVV